MNTQKSEDIIEMEKLISQAQPAIDLYASLERLKLNPDFKNIIGQHYLKDEAVRLVHLKADPNVQTPNAQEGIDKMISAIGFLNAFFNTISNEGRRALRQKSDAENALVEIGQEE